MFLGKLLTFVSISPREVNVPGGAAFAVPTGNRFLFSGPWIRPLFTRLLALGDEFAGSVQSRSPHRTTRNYLRLRQA